MLEIKAKISLCISKLWLKGGFLFLAKKWVYMWLLAADFESGFHGEVFWYSITEVALPGSQELHTFI